MQERKNACEWEVLAYGTLEEEVLGLEIGGSRGR